VLEGDPVPPRKGHSSSPLFSAHIYCGHGRPSQLLLSCCILTCFQQALLLGRIADAVYYYRRSSMVRSSVGRSVCLSVTIVSPAKTAEPIEMLFGMWTRVDSMNHVFDGIQIPPREEAILWREMASHCKV